jgi:hypothetical protein
MNPLPKRISNFLTGFLPLTAIGVVLTIIRGHNTLVFCNTLTPAVGPSAGDFCVQVAWLPFWDALLFVPVGIGIGIWLALRSRSPKYAKDAKIPETRQNEGRDYEKFDSSDISRSGRHHARHRNCFWFIGFPRN